MSPRIFDYLSMGTGWAVTIWDSVSDEEFLRWKDEIIEMSHSFDETYSRFIKSSLVWQLAEGPGIYTVPADFVKMLRLYLSLYLPTGGKLNPLIGFTISDLGYDENYSLVPKGEIRSTPDLLGAVTILSDTEIELKDKVLFDLGALGKGYFVDRVGDFLKEKGLKHFLVNGSGDIFYQGSDFLRVGLEDPDDRSKVIGQILIDHGGLCASGVNRRRWDKYHHVIDPTQNSSTTGLLAVWVWAENAALADALASCLFFVSPEELVGVVPHFEYCLMNDERRIKKSAGFTADFF